MAAPPTTTLQNLTGNWTLNSSLSDDFTQALKLQSVSFFIRAVAPLATVHMKVLQPNSDQNHKSIKQFATALKIPGTEEEYFLDWEWRTTKDPLYGDIEVRARWVTVAEAREEGFDGTGGDGNEIEKEQQEEEGKGKGRRVKWLLEEDSEGMMVQTVARKVDGAWGSMNFWGFALTTAGKKEEEAVRRYVRRTRLWKNSGEVLWLTAIYDWNGE